MRKRYKQFKMRNLDLTSYIICFVIIIIEIEIEIEIGVIC